MTKAATTIGVVYTVVFRTVFAAKRLTAQWADHWDGQDPRDLPGHRTALRSIR